MFSLKFLFVFSVLCVYFQAYAVPEKDVPQCASGIVFQAYMTSDEAVVACRTYSAEEHECAFGARFHGYSTYQEALDICKDQTPENARCAMNQVFFGRGQVNFSQAMKNCSGK